MMDIRDMATSVSICLKREIDGAVWYFAGLPEYWADDVRQLLADLFKHAESEIENTFPEISDNDHVSQN
jgi:hypothetical protein